MNALLVAMRRSLVELNLGLKGDLTMTEPMEQLTKALANDSVPEAWTKLAYPSLRPLSSWMVNMLQRVTQLVDWTTDLSVPKSVWLSGAPPAGDCIPLLLQASLIKMLHSIGWLDFHKECL